MLCDFSPLSGRRVSNYSELGCDVSRGILQKSPNSVMEMRL